MCVCFDLWSVSNMGYRHSVTDSRGKCETHIFWQYRWPTCVCVCVCVCRRLYSSRSSTDAIMPADTAAYKGQKYSALKKKAKSSGILFRDPEFPPNNKSLFCNKPKNINIEWKRPYVRRFISTIYIQGVPKNDPTWFCQNFVKSPPNLIIFGTLIAKMIGICKVHLLSLLCLCQRTTVKNDASNCCIMLSCCLRKSSNDLSRT